ncbi:hypothetical protein Dimus_034234 [Dionaea muscipula]
MELKDGADNRTFRVNFSAEGAGKLRATVTDKLKEFMGEYTDDTLVEYVIVLLRNGRSKDEAKNELDVFLGDDSSSFVTWLWDHLVSNIDLYVLPKESRPEEVSKARPAILENAAKSVSHEMDSGSDRGKNEKVLKPQHPRELKGIDRNVAQPPPFTSNVVEVHKEGETHLEASHQKHSVSAEFAGRRKRNRPEERTRSKKEAVSKGSVNAPMRLLQFAMRDAVATSRPSHSLSEPAVKRLRSVVSSSTADLIFEEHNQKFHSVARVPNVVETAVRTVAEAAEDVMKKYKPTRNVFDRLSHSVEVQEISTQVLSLKSGLDDEEYDAFDKIHGVTPEMDNQTNVYGSKYVGISSMIGNDSALNSDNEGSDAVNVMSRGIENVSQIGTSVGKKNDDSLMVHYSVAQNTDKVMRPSQTREPDPSVAIASASRKMVNISVNVNTWKPPHYQPSVEVEGLETQKYLQSSDIAAGKSDVRFTKENINPLTVNGKGKPAVDVQTEVPKSLPSAPGSYFMGSPLEDVDSRTIFVNNVTATLLVASIKLWVHFAATKDNLSRHFNKFGEVLKVIILVDPASGLPKGSASILVVHKTAAHQEPGPIMSWPQVARGSPFAVSRFPRPPFPRAFPGAYRARPPLIKPGARSLQWKRDSQPTSPSVSSIGPSPSPRGLTYVRSEPKADANPTAS